MKTEPNANKSSSFAHLIWQHNYSLGNIQGRNLVVVFTLIFSSGIPKGILLILQICTVFPEWQWFKSNTSQTVQVLLAVICSLSAAAAAVCEEVWCEGCFHSLSFQSGSRHMWGHKTLSCLIKTFSLDVFIWTVWGLLWLDHRVISEYWGCTFSWRNRRLMLKKSESLILVDYSKRQSSI